MKKREILVIDDFLTLSYHQTIFNIVTSKNFSWNYVHNVTSATVEENLYGNGSFGFQHDLIRYYRGEVIENISGFQPFVMALLFQIKDIIGAESVIRSRVDMTMYNPEKFMHGVHTDLPGLSHWSSVYYVNDSDGETFIYDSHEDDCPITEADLSISNIKEVVQPKANRVVIFDGNYYHTGHSPSEHKNRIIINSNFK